MGGNVVIGDQSADRIPMQNDNRDTMTYSLWRFMRNLNMCSQFWDDINGSIFAGSTAQLMDSRISDTNFSIFKASVGDIDLFVNENRQAILNNWFRNLEPGSTVADMKFIGYKLSGDQTITLWRFDKLQINVQVDFVFVKFNDDRPTEWSQFSHNSADVDFFRGIKGVAHKFMLRALNARRLIDCVILNRKGIEKRVLSAEVAVSPSGFRRKLEPVMEYGAHQYNKDGLPMYRELSTAETGFVTDLTQIFHEFFGRFPTAIERNAMFSFCGLIQLVKQEYSCADQFKVANGFAYTLWGKPAQMLYRDDPKRDEAEKIDMMDFLADSLNIARDHWDGMRAAYYEKRK